MYELQFGTDMSRTDILRSNSKDEVEAILFREVALHLPPSCLKQSRQDVEIMLPKTYNTILQ
jgi:hypothetical protein